MRHYFQAWISQHERAKAYLVDEAKDNSKLNLKSFVLSDSLDAGVTKIINHGWIRLIILKIMDIISVV